LAAGVTAYQSQAQKEAERERAQRKQSVESILNKLNQLNDKESHFVDAAACLRDIAQKVDMQRKDNKQGVTSSITNAELNSALDTANEKVKNWANSAKCVTKQDLRKDCSLMSQSLVTTNFCAGDLAPLYAAQWEEFFENVQKNVNTLIALRHADQAANWS
jgi:hypothetical protein